MTKIEQLLAENKKLLLSFKTPRPEVFDTVIQLPWKYSYLQVLTPVGYALQDCIVNVFFDELEQPLQTPKENITLVIHGHPRTGFCATPTQCHVLGYTPVGNEGTPFLHNWERFDYAVL